MTLIKTAHRRPTVTKRAYRISKCRSVSHVTKVKHRTCHLFLQGGTPNENFQKFCVKFVHQIVWPSLRGYCLTKFKWLSLCRRRACVSLLVLVKSNRWVQKKKSNKWDGIKTLVYIEKLNVWNTDNKSTHILEANYLLNRIDFLCWNIFIWLNFFVWYMCFIFLEFLKSIASSLRVVGSIF